MVFALVGVKAYKSLTQNPAEPEPTAEQQARLPVRVTRAETGLAQQWVFDDGIVWPVKRRVLTFQAEGDIQYIDKVNGRDLRAGDIVRTGQVLAKIDSRRQQSALDTANADVAVAVQERDQAQARVVQAKASLDSSKSDLALAESELVRHQELFEEGVIPESDRDVYINQVDQAKAALRSVEQDVRSAEDGVRSAEAQIIAAQARVRESDVDMEDTQLVAPIDGVVAYINIREGEYWDAQRLDSSSDQALIESAPIILVNPQDIEVEIEIQADEANDIDPGQLAYVILEEDVDEDQAKGVSNQGLLAIAQARGSQGQVFSVSPTQTPGSRGTQVSIRGLSPGLRVGGRAYAWIEANVSPNTVLLPLGALLPRDGTFYAFVVNQADGTVERREVEQGIEGVNGIEILSGIQAGELVVTEGINRLVDGTPVDIVGREAN